MPSNPKSKNTRSTSKQQEKPRVPSPPHDDQETQISYMLIQRMQRELVLLRETITKQNEKITSLERKLGHLDSNIVALKSQLAFANHVTDVLREKLDYVEQYSHRPCLVIERIRSRENETEASVAKSVIDITTSINVTGLCR